MMNLQNLAIIFIIIILPISLLLQAYTQSQIDTLNLQISYDSKLTDSTYDAIKAFQLNTVNSSTSDLANSKMRDIEASINTFFTSIATNFDVQGYNASNLEDYVPALVYTLYDGYYIYSPYTNTIEEEDNGTTYTNDKKLSGLKPFIYYSCRYINGSDDFVITYSLDNYITIQGLINSEWINDSGYLINIKDGVTEVGKDFVTYRGCTIKKEQNLMQEYVGPNQVGSSNENENLYSYIKINGVKYYYDNKNSDSKYKDKWFYLMNGKKVYINEQYNKDYDYSAYNYYAEACTFTNKVLNKYNLKNLKAENAVDSKGKSYGPNENPFRNR